MVAGLVNQLASLRSVLAFVVPACIATGGLYYMQRHHYPLGHTIKVGAEEGKSEKGAHHMADGYPGARSLWEQLMGGPASFLGACMSLEELEVGFGAADARPPPPPPRPPPPPLPPPHPLPRRRLVLTCLAGVPLPTPSPAERVV